MPRFIWINGRLVPSIRAVIPTSDSAYLYGYGLFETLRAIQGKVLFLKNHLARLSRNARAVGLTLPVSRTRLKREILRALKKNRLREAAIRLILSESEGRPRLVIRARPCRPLPRRLYQTGCRLVLARSVRADSKGISRIKSTSYLTKILARREAKRRGADEAILVNEKGHVTEGASSNLFIVKKGRLFTPPLSDGLLPGTRRKVVLSIARRLKIPVVEKTLTVRDLTTAEEVFITSTLKDVMPVGWVDGKRLARAPGPVTRRIAGGYGKFVVRESSERRNTSPARTPKDPGGR